MDLESFIVRRMGNGRVETVGDDGVTRQFINQREAGHWLDSQPAPPEPPEPEPEPDQPEQQPTRPRLKKKTQAKA